jgi:hypothetical protein
MDNLKIMKGNIKMDGMNKTIEIVKKTKNTSVKNLNVTFYNHENEVEREVTVPNMYQMWKGARNFYSNDANLGKRITVEFNGEIVKDIHGERKSSGRLWMVDKMQIGKHVSEKNKSIVDSIVENKEISE